MIDKSLIGTTFDPFSFKVESGKIKEFCLALGDTNPLFTDAESAREAGHPQTPLPLTFPTTFVFWGYPQLWKKMQDIGIDTGKILHLKEEYEYLSPIYPGMEVHGQIKIEDIKTGKLNMVTFETLYTLADGSELLKEKMTIAIRKE